MQAPFQANRFWDDRYSQAEFVYGTQPNQFFAQALRSLQPGHLLLPAEGEGRNAVYAASQGWHVDAFDFSEEGRQKALRLAAQRGVSIGYELSDLLTFDTPTRYDALALIYVHLAPAPRRDMLVRFAGLLKPGGTLILEGFHPRQIGNPSGGPNAPEFCYTVEELRAVFAEGFSIQQLNNESITLAEGAYHHGPAHVTRLTALKL